MSAFGGIADINAQATNKFGKNVSMISGTNG
jgi:hypothetical protein